MTRQARSPLDPKNPTATTKTRSWKPNPLVLLARRPVVYWAAVAALVVLTVIAVRTANRSANQLFDSYGSTQPVLVIVRPVPAGGAIDAASELREIPVGLLPDQPATEVPPGAVASTELWPGEIVLKSRLVSSDAVLVNGRVGVALPVSAITPPLRAGDDVLLVVTLDPFGAGQHTQIGAVVLTVSEEQVLVAVAHDDLAVVMSSLVQGTLAIALGTPAG